MTEPFKNLLNRARIEECAHRLAALWPAFDRGRFVALAAGGLDALEMKARAMQIAAALQATLPPRFDDAAALIEASLGPPLPLEGEPPAAAQTGTGLAGWIVWPLGEAVARAGLAEPERALRTLHALTQRLTAEWAIRPFLLAHPELVFATLARWCRDPSAHVRRLASEGSRPRLPWGLQLKTLIADPSPTLPLLAALQDDPSPYVRRSVANHLNDIAKDHPGLVAGWIERHLPGAPPARQALLRHAARTLVKRGDPRVLAAFGVGRPLHGEARLALAPARLVLGGTLKLSVELVSHARGPQPLVVDIALHHVKADGRTSPKVFKGWRLELAAGETRQLEKSHPVRPITTRRYHAGTHRVELLVNGAVVAEAAFELRIPRAAGAR